jgi:hypothetical protein
MSCVLGGANPPNSGPICCYTSLNILYAFISNL